MFTRKQKGDDYMSEREKEILQKVKAALPTMTEFQKGYILGRVEIAAEASGRPKTESSPS